MLRLIRATQDNPLSEQDLRRARGVDPTIVARAAEILAEVAANGDDALRSLTKLYDGADIETFRVTDSEIDRAVESVDPAFIETLEQIKDSIETFHARQVQQSWFSTRADGAIVGSKIEPLDSVGIYVPGGRAQYPSTVLMNAVPAKVAGVRRIAMVCPPGDTGAIDPATLAAARIAGVTEVYKVGGAQAIAALAYGTRQIPRVDKITGPGNAYVAAAKKLVVGEVGIDMIAGPSEVLILADETAEPSLVAIDLMAQAEHDPLASSYLVTTDPALPELVERELEGLLADSTRMDITRSSLEERGVCVLCDTLATALDAANVVAPEHLEVMMDEPFELLGSIRNAGAIFLGPWTPESVGDYVAGPNHTLPTGGTARFSSPLSVDDFCKKSSILSYSFSALQNDAHLVEDIAGTEGLWAHGRAVSLRLEIANRYEEEFDDAGGSGVEQEDGTVR